MSENIVFTFMQAFHYNYASYLLCRDMHSISDVLEILYCCFSAKCINNVTIRGANQQNSHYQRSRKIDLLKNDKENFRNI